MNRHTPTGRRVVGLALALFTALIWGMLPVVLKVLVKRLDVYTLTWFRFLMAGLLMLPLVMRQQRWRAIFRVRGVPLMILLLGIVGLCGNYLTFMSGLSFVSPSSAQVVIQLSPMFVLLGGLVIFGETFSRLQWLGFGTLVVGLLLFFNPHYGDLLGTSATYAGGILLIVVAAVLWAAYMMSQKELLMFMSSESVLFAIYFSGAVLLLPFVHLSQLADLDKTHVLLLAASALMTMLSYLSFAKALEHVEMSRVGVVVALTPLITLTTAGLGAVTFPEALVPERLNPVGMVGAAMVVVGSMLGALDLPTARSEGS